MFRSIGNRLAEGSAGLRRREFLGAGGLSTLGLGFGLHAQTPAVLNSTSRSDVSCILLMLVGGPSQLDTWDMKPDAPAEIRGPYRPIRTNVPGVEISEIFPRMAKHADKFPLVRGMYHTSPAVHDTGHQLMQTGRAFDDGLEHPHFGCVLKKLKGASGELPTHVMLPGPIGSTGGNMPHGQCAGYLGESFDPFVPYSDPALRLPGAFDLGTEPESVRQRYGTNRFGQSCLLARRLVEAGVRFVTVNMFDTVFDQTTWDIHGCAPFSPIRCYGDFVGPMFDMAYSSLLEDLSDRGLLASTMVVGFGEFGRTPKLNPAGGRDHWPQSWTILMGGGPLKGGTVVGPSDKTGSAPKDRPTHPAEVAATIYKGLGIDYRTELCDGQGRRIPLVDPGFHPIHELFS